jgi:Carboxypeptidase regulatory-like domain/TonB-dependent Receptor Plug Domain
MKSVRAKLLGLSVVVAFLSLLCFGQNITASLTGTVTDPSGAIVSGASVTLHNDDTNSDVVTVKTDSNGAYTASELPLGTYTVTVQGQGFKKFIANGVALHVGEHRALNMKLEVGGVAEEVTVTASTVPIQTASAAQDTTITGTQIRELQLNNRNFEQLLMLEPGVANGLPDQVGFGIENTTSVSVNGARSSANNWTVDGTDINDSGSNATLLNVPSVDALSEFTLERSTYDAQYGRSGGGQVNVVTKSGTSQFHGDAYEFFRNNVLDANEYFNKAAGNPRPPFRYNDFGYTFGGPFFIPDHYNTDRSKTFFFWSEEWRRTRTPSTDILGIPSPQELTGNFTGLDYPDGTPVTLNAASAPSGCITGNVINPSCFSANAKVYLANVYSKFTPNSALSPSALTENYTFPVSAADDYRQEIVRVDQKLTNKVQAFARYMQDKVPTTEPGGLFAGEGLPGISDTATNAPGRNFVAHVTMQLSPMVMNEIAFGDSWGAINSKITGLIDSTAFLSALSFAGGLPFTDPYHRVPGISISDVQGVGIPVSPYFERNIDKSIYDNVSVSHGSHTIRTGLSVQLMRKTENAVNPTNGSFSFGNNYGNPAFANFLLGYANGFSQDSRDIIPNLHFPNIEAYVQDDWKVTHTFTLNLGLRYAFFAPPEDDNQVLDNFSPLAYNPNDVPILDANGNFVLGQAATPQNYANGLIIAQNACNPNLYFAPPVAPYGPTCSPYGDRVNPNYNTFAPRFGFAWDVLGDGKTALRGGFGVYYDRTLDGIEEQNSFENPPFLGTVSVAPTVPVDLFDNVTAVAAAPPLAPVGLHVTGSPAFQIPYIDQWSLSIERELAPDTRLEVAYVGNRADHLLGEFDLNQVPLNVREANPTADVNNIRPYLGYGPITEIGALFKSNYNSLQISANRRIAAGLTFGVAYTWSKTLTNNPSDRSDAPYDTYNFGADYGPASFSLGQVLVINYVYDLPFYKSQQGLLGHVLGGWEVSGISSFETGFPTTIYQYYDPFNSLDWPAGSPNTYLGGIGIDPSVVAPRPDRAAGSSCSGPGTVAQYINTAAFTDAIGHFGDSGRGICTGPGLNNWDISAMKNIKISERFTMQFRSEFFNAFNHVSFNSFDNYTDDSTFGQLNGDHDPRIIQLGLKLYF